MANTTVVVNASKGYGYNYASLGDIANQGFKIPKMKTATEGEKEFVYYYDSELNEWIRGAEIIIPESKGMNKAQLYGSALTYARRYTSLMALQLACADDSVIEDIESNGERKSLKKAENKANEPTAQQTAELRQQMFVELATDEQKRLIQERYSQAEIMKMLSNLKKTFDQLTLDEAKKMLEARSGK